jgi:hypothetical protein
MKMARVPRGPKATPVPSAASQEAKIAQALQAMSAALRKKRHFVGYGVGRKTAAGKKLPGLAAILLVDKKVQLRSLKAKDRLPVEINVGGTMVATDVVALSPAKLLGNPAANQARVRPLQGGVSISVCPKRDDSCPGFGTGGALVKDSSGGYYLLSAAHVMNVQFESVIQPGSTHGGHNHKKTFAGYVGGKKVYKYQPARDNVGGVVRIAPAGIDAAAAECIQMLTTQINLGGQQAPAGVVAGLPVQKSGAATGVTSGKVTLTQATIVAGAGKIISGAMAKAKVPGWKKNTAVNGLFFISPGTFADHGDSGSLIMAGGTTAADKAFLKQNGITMNAALGLLIANVNTGTETFVIGQEINLGLNALKVSLVV